AQVADADVGVALEHMLGHFAGHVREDGVAHGRIGFGEVFHRRRQEVDQERVHGGDRHMALALAFERIEFGAHQVKVMQGGTDVLLQPLARCVEANAGGYAVEQLGAQFAFQPQDLPVHGAGCDEQVFLRLADRAGARDLEEVFQDDGMHAPNANAGRSARPGSHRPYHWPCHCGLRFCWNALTPSSASDDCSAATSAGRRSAWAWAGCILPVARTTCLIACSDSGAQARMSSTQRCTAASRAARGTTSLIRPSSSARAAEMRLPVNSMPMACRYGIWRCNKVMPPSSGMRPTSGSGSPKLASSQATTMSQPSTISKPPPSA